MVCSLGEFMHYGIAHNVGAQAILSYYVLFMLVTEEFKHSEDLITYNKAEIEIILH